MTEPLPKPRADPAVDALCLDIRQRVEQLPPQEVLQAKLHKALVEARAKLELKRTEVADE